MNGALPATLAAQMAAIREQVLSGRPHWGGEEVHLSTERYVSDAVWRQEVLRLFRPLPLIAAHSSELAPGQALAHDGFDVPLLLTRDADGEVRAFLNVCRHRGMRLVEAAPQAQDRASLVCPYHGWTYRLDGGLRHMLHSEAFDACPAGGRDLVPLPCAERHGLIWVVPHPGGRIDLPAFLGGLDEELPWYGINDLQLFRTVRADYPANWKLVVDAFLEPYHIRVLHKDTIYPFFTDGITAAVRHGDHISSLVARRDSEAWSRSGEPPPTDADALRRIASPTHVIFPNTITIFHPDYLSLITVYPAAAGQLRWTHRMLIPRHKATPDWTPHWEKTFRLIEQGVFQKEDIRCAVEIQKGIASGANAWFTAGRVEQALGWFHASVDRHLATSAASPAA